jgi:hypothetical protein
MEQINLHKKWVTICESFEMSWKGLARGNNTYSVMAFIANIDLIDFV